MRTEVQKVNNGIMAWDWLLIIGLTLSPMNEFRIWKIGPGEFLILLWCLRYFPRYFKSGLDQMITRFWMLFLPVICLGTCYCVMFYPDEASPGDLLTFVFFAIVSIGIVNGLQDRTPEQIRRILYAAGIAVGLWNMFLYLYSMNVSKTFFGARIWYYHVRYSGGANNPHHVATLLGAALFINIIHFTDRKSSFYSRAAALAAGGLCVFISMKTKSSTLIASLALSFLLFVYFLLAKRIQNKKQLWIAASVLIIIASIGIGIYLEQILESALQWVESDVNGLERFEIFLSIGGTLKKSWIIGLGPGIHGMDGKIEYHNSYLEVLAMGGVIGLALVVLFSVRLYKAVRRDSVMLFCLIPIYLYGMGGFSMRRLSFWIIAAMVAAYGMNLSAREEPGADESHSPSFAASAGGGRRP